MIKRAIVCISTCLFLVACNKDYTQEDTDKKVAQLGITATLINTEQSSDDTIYYYKDNNNFEFNIFEEHTISGIDSTTFDVSSLKENYHYLKLKSIDESEYYPFTLVDHGEYNKSELTAKCNNFEEFTALDTLISFRDKFKDICNTTVANKYEAPVFATIECGNKPYYLKAEFLTDKYLEELQKRLVHFALFYRDSILLDGIPDSVKNKYEFKHLKLIDSTGYSHITEYVVLDGNTFLPGNAFYDFCKDYNIEITGNRDNFSINTGKSIESYSKNDEVSFFIIEELTGKQCSEE